MSADTEALPWSRIDGVVEEFINLSLDAAEKCDNPTAKLAVLRTLTTVCRIVNTWNHCIQKPLEMLVLFLDDAELGHCYGSVIIIVTFLIHFLGVEVGEASCAKVK